MSKDKKTVKLAYYKLGKKASSFFDSVARMKVSPTKPGSVPRKERTEKIRKAASSGFLIEIDEDEFNEMNAAIPVLKKGKVAKGVDKPVVVKETVHTPEVLSLDELEGMKVTDLKLHAVKFATSEKEITGIMKMKTDDLIDFITGAQGNSSESSESVTKDEDDEDENEDEDTTDDENEDEDTEDDDDDEK